MTLGIALGKILQSYNKVYAAVIVADWTAVLYIAEEAGKETVGEHLEKQC